MLDLINKLDTEHILTTEQKLWMATALQSFNEHAIYKYIKGQKEHGGNLVERDTIVDMAEEIIDLFWYMSVVLSKRNKK